MVEGTGRPFYLVDRTVPCHVISVNIFFFVLETVYLPTRFRQRWTPSFTKISGTTVVDTEDQNRPSCSTGSFVRRVRPLYTTTESPRTDIQSTEVK